MKKMRRSQKSPLAEAEQLSVAGDDQAAADTLTDMLRDEPENIPARALLARVRFDLHDHVGALALAETVLEVDPENPALRLLRAQCLIDSGRFSEALEEATSVLHCIDDREIDVSVLPPAFMRTLLRTHWRALRDSGNLEAALAISRARQVFDPLEWTDRVIGTLQRMGRFEEAEIATRRGLDGEAKALWDNGHRLFYMGAYEESSRSFLRRLAFARLPSEFEFLQGYLESLAHSGNIFELAAVANHWLKSGKVKKQKQVINLQVLTAFAHVQLGNKQEFETLFEELNIARGSKSWHEWIRGFAYFMETADLLVPIFVSCGKSLP